VTFGIAREPGEPRNRIWSGDREYRECRRGGEVRILLTFLYSGHLDGVRLAWVLEDAEDRIEMRDPLQGGSGNTPTEMNLGFAGLIPEFASIPELPRGSQAVEKLPVTASGPRFGLKTACFGALKPDLKPLEPVYAAMDVPGSSFSTG